MFRFASWLAVVVALVPGGQVVGVEPEPPQASSSDAWNGATIITDSGHWADSPPQNAFGGESHWSGLIFSDISETQFVEWSTFDPVTIRMVGVFLVHDVNYNKRRALDFTIKAKVQPGDPFTTILGRTISTPGGGNSYGGGQFGTEPREYYSILDVDAVVADARLFRAEFTPNTVGASGTTGVRVMELDGYLIPEPCTLVLLGMGAVGLLAYAWRWQMYSVPEQGSWIVPRRDRTRGKCTPSCRHLAGVFFVALSLWAHDKANAHVSYPPLQWLGQDILQPTTGSSRLYVDEDEEVLAFAKNGQTRDYQLSFYSSGAGWTQTSVPPGRRPVEVLKSNYGAAIRTDDNGSTPTRLWSLPDGGKMVELFAGNPRAGGGPNGVAVGADGVISFYNAADNHSGTPKDYYRWTPTGGLEALPHFPTDPTYSDRAQPHVDVEGRVVVMLSDGIWRYDATAWTKIASPPTEGSFTERAPMEFAPDGDLVIPVRLEAAGGDRTWRWLRYDELSGRYTTLYEVPILKEGLDVQIWDARLCDDGTLLFYAYSYYYGLQAEALTQVAPGGEVVILEDTVPGGLKIDYNRFRFNDAGDVLARTGDLETGVWDYRLWSDGRWTSMLPPELSSQVSSFALGDSGKAYFAFIDDGGRLDVGVVPEPSTLILLGIGAVGLLAYAWRRRKQIIRVD